MAGKTVTLTLTEDEATALYNAALAGQYEYCDTIDHDPDRTVKAKRQIVADLDRAIAKLRDA